jgi:hypothetical protein
MKRTAEEAFGVDLDPDVECMPTIKRPRFTPLNVNQRMMLGLVPSMTISTYSKKPPNANIVGLIRRFLLSGIKSQKQIARECGLSPTKMSQFMNLAPRTKGWSAVEAEILAWIENFEKESERNQILPTPAKPSCHIVPEPTVKLEGMEVRVKNIYNPGQSGVTSTLSVKPYPEAATLNSPSDESIYAQSYYNSHPYDSPSSSIVSSESCPDFLSCEIESGTCPDNNDLCNGYEWNSDDSLSIWS